MALFTLTTLPQSTATLWLQPDGLYLATSSGVSGEASVSVSITDAVCLDDVDSTGAETTSDLQALSQDIYHILLESFGSNIDDPSRGIGVRGLLNGTSQGLTRAAGILDSQLRKDNRIDSSRTTITFDSTTQIYTLNLMVVAAGNLLPMAYNYTQAGGLVPA